MVGEAAFREVLLRLPKTLQIVMGATMSHSARAYDRHSG